MVESVSRWRGCARLLTLVGLLTGCASQGPLQPPDVDTGEQWNTVPVADTATAPPDELWWQGFGSAGLDRLIQRAFAHSPDLAATAERLFQAEQQVRLAGSSLLPSLSLSASSGQRFTDNQVGSDRSESSSLGLSIGYELDLWGRLAAARDEARASYQASAYDYQSARLSLASAVASSWFQLLALDEQLRVAAENLRISERTQDIVTARYRNGAASRAELLRQQTSVLNQRAALVPIQQQYRQTRSALAVLVGESPLGFQVNSRDQGLLQMAIPQVAVGVPAELLTRRPDLAREEARLRAAGANLSQARNAYLPTVTLGLNASADSADLLSLANPAETAGWALSLAQSLFDGGRRDAQEAISESGRLELVQQYRGAVLSALQETDDALDRVRTSQQREAIQRHVSEQAARTLELTELRYREGSDDLLTLLDAQSTLFDTRNQLVTLRLQRLLATVDLYKALGGGWQRTVTGNEKDEQ